jgi:hypothetical protein
LRDRARSPSSTLLRFRVFLLAEQFGTEQQEALVVARGHFGDTRSAAAAALT